MIIYKKQGVKV